MSTIACMEPDRNDVVVIGAGIGGLAAAVRLAAAGRSVCVIEARDAPGGKMRTIGSAAGPVDAGPTVLTLRGVFDDLFAAAGTCLEDHLSLIPQPVIARHWWDDGSTLDLLADPAENLRAINAFGGSTAEADVRRFSSVAASLFSAFDAPVIRAPAPEVTALVAATLARPKLWSALLPRATLARYLARRIRDPRLAQLFGRYATYVGGSPFAAPAVLGLIWHSEAAGVWAVKGGMHRLAAALADLAVSRGVRFRYGTSVDEILVVNRQVRGVVLSDRTTIPAVDVIFNGDPAALARGHLGANLKAVVPSAAIEPRSHSAWVWSFAATVSGPPLSLHNVFFATDARKEFLPIASGRMPEEATLYLCAQDRADGSAPTGRERFQIILNAAPTGHTARAASDEEYRTCRRLTFDRLARFGLTFDPVPGPDSLTGPPQFAAMFPGSQGALYGRSPNAMMATFQRPTAKTGVAGLWLAGGGVHPGPGVPMAAMSGVNAAEAILGHRGSTLPSLRTATPGGMSTASPTTPAVPYR